MCAYITWSAVSHAEELRGKSRSGEGACPWWGWHDVVLVLLFLLLIRVVRAAAEPGDHDAVVRGGGGALHPLPSRGVRAGTRTHSSIGAMRESLSTRAPCARARVRACVWAPARLLLLPARFPKQHPQQHVSVHCRTTTHNGWHFQNKNQFIVATRPTCSTGGASTTRRCS